MGGGIPPLAAVWLEQQRKEAAAQQEQYQQYSIGYSLAFALLSDTLGKDVPDLLPLLKEAVSWVVEMGTSDLKFHAMLDALGVPHKVISAEQLALASLNPSQTVLVNCWEEMNVDLLDEELVQRLVQFVHSGGQLIAFNCAMKMIARAFPNKISGSDRQMMDYSHASITVVSKDEPMLNGYNLLAMDCVLEPGSRAIRVLDKSSVSGLATMPVAVLGDRFAVVKFKASAGTVYQFSCALVERERVSSNPKVSCTPYVQRMGGSQATVTAWECAVKCGFRPAIAVAQAAYPLVHAMAYAIASHKREWRNYVPPVPVEQQPQLPPQQPGLLPLPDANANSNTAEVNSSNTEPHDQGGAGNHGVTTNGSDPMNS